MIQGVIINNAVIILLCFIIHYVSDKCDQRKGQWFFNIGSKMHFQCCVVIFSVQRLSLVLGKRLNRDCHRGCQTNALFFRLRSVHIKLWLAGERDRERSYCTFTFLFMKRCVCILNYTYVSLHLSILICVGSCPWEEALSLVLILKCQNHTL